MLALGGGWMVGGRRVFQTREQPKQHNLGVPARDEIVRPLIQTYEEFKGGGKEH